MNFEAMEVPVRDFLEHGRVPERVFRKEGLHAWKTLSRPADFNAPGGNLDWTLTRHGDRVRVELHPYQVQGATPTQGVLAGFSLAALIAPQLGPFERAIVFIGAPHEELPDGSMRFWLNVAVQYSRQGGG